MEQELSDGETILWAVQPAPTLMALRNLPKALFAIPYAGFAIFWIWGASGEQVITGEYWRSFSTDMLFPAFGLIFVFVGMHMLLSPFLAWRDASRTAYAVTNRRALTIRPRNWGRTEVQAWPLEDLESPTLRESSSGGGDLIFEEFVDGAGKSRRTVTRGFLDLARVPEAAAVLREAVERRTTV